MHQEPDLHCENCNRGTYGYGEHCPDCQRALAEFWVEKFGYKFKDKAKHQYHTSEAYWLKSGSKVFDDSLVENIINPDGMIKAWELAESRENWELLIMYGQVWFQSGLKETKYLKRHFGNISEEEIIIKINEEEILEGMEHLRVKV